MGFKVIRSGSDDVAIEDNWPDHQKIFKPEQMSAMVLGELKRQAETVLGKTADDAVITVPAACNHTQRMATKTAGIIAGFENITVINEPTAVVLAWVYENRDVAFDGRRKVILVFNMRGGTTLYNSLQNVFYTIVSHVFNFLAPSVVYGSVYCSLDQ